MLVGFRDVEAQMFNGDVLVVQNVTRGFAPIDSTESQKRWLYQPPFTAPTPELVARCKEAWILYSDMAFLPEPRMSYWQRVKRAAKFVSACRYYYSPERRLFRIWLCHQLGGVRFLQLANRVRI